MSEPPRHDTGPDAPSPPTPPLAWSELPLRERRKIQAVVFIVGLFLAFVVAAYMCEAAVGEPWSCAATEGIAFGGLVVWFVEPLRRRMARRWPDRWWQDTLLFPDVVRSGCRSRGNGASGGHLTVVSVPTPLPSATHE